MPLPVLRSHVVLGTRTQSHGDPLPLRARGSHLDGNCLFFFFSNYFFYKLFFFISAVLGLCSAGGLSLVSVRRGYSPVAVLRLLIAVASLITENRF